MAGVRVTTVLCRANDHGQGHAQICEFHQDLPTCHLDPSLIKGIPLFLMARRAVLQVRGLGSEWKLAIYLGRLGTGRGAGTQGPLAIHERFLDMFSRAPSFQEKARTKQPLKMELLLLVSEKYPDAVGLYECHKRN